MPAKRSSARNASAERARPKVKEAEQKKKAQKSSPSGGFLKRYSVPSVRPKTTSNVGGVAKDYEISRYPPPAMYGSPPLGPKPCEIESQSEPSDTPTCRPHATKGSESDLIARRPHTAIGLPTPHPMSVVSQGALASPSTRTSSPTVNPSVVYPPARVQYPKNFSMPPENPQDPWDVDAGKRPSTARLAEWKFRRSIFADEMHFVMTQTGLVEPESFKTKQLSMEGIESWDPQQTGSYPPRPIDMFIFSNIKFHHLNATQVEDIEEDVEWKPQPETDVQPAEGLPVKGYSYVDLKGVPYRLSKPLELFDNPDLDLVHPSQDIAMVGILCFLFFCLRLKHEVSFM